MSESDDIQHGQSLERLRAKQRRKGRFVWMSVLALAIAGIAYFGLNAGWALSKISDGSTSRSPVLQFIGEALDPNALAGEGDGRINILLIGVGGSGHKGGALADTVMVASLDPTNKKLALLSIPRDLRVPIAGSDTTGKINAAHSYGESAEPGTGPTVLKDTVHGILDLPIHYYVRVDFQGFRKLIDEVGGVTIDVPTPLNDPLFPDEELEGYEPLYVPAGLQKMDGKLALKYARSRETTSDFARAGRQQQILVAFREKALSAGILANPKKLSDIISILGNHVRTDLGLSDMQRLIGLLKDVDQKDVITKVLDNSAEGPLRSTSEGGYFLVPRAGDFSEVRRIAYELFTDPYLVREQAGIQILNATGTAGNARELELDLESLGYSIASIDRVDTQEATQLLDFSDGQSPFTIRFLEERLGVKASKQIRPKDVDAGIDVQLVLGADYSPGERQ